MEQTDKAYPLSGKISSLIRISEEQLVAYLWVIDAPPSLEGVQQVSGQFIKIADTIKAICRIEHVTEHFDDRVIDDCRQAASALINCKTDLEAAFPRCNTHRLNKKPFHGLITKWELYTCLGVSNLEGNDSTRHLLLEAYLVVASGILRHRKEHDGWHDPKEYQVALEESCRLGRKLLLPPMRDSLNSLPPKLLGMHKEYQSSIKRTGILLKCIHTLLDYAFSGKRAPTYIKSGKARMPCIARHSVNDAVDPALIGKVDAIELLQSPAEPACRLDAPETGGGVDYYHISPPDFEGNSSEQHERKKRHYLASIAMHNQRLPFRWEMLSMYELSCFMEVVGQLAEGMYQSGPHGRINQCELAAVAVTLLLRSIPLHQITLLKISDASYKETDPPGYRYYGGNKTGCWVMFPQFLPMDMMLGSKFYASAESRRQFYFLRSGTSLERIIDTYISTVRGKGATGRFLFPGTPYRYEQALNQIIARINEQQRTRLTLKRIEIFLYSHLARSEGADLTTAMLLTGREDFLGMPPLHYTALPVKRLQELYYNSCRKLLGDVCQELTEREALPPGLQNPQDYYQHAHSWTGMVGTAYRPRKKAVKKMVSALQDRMRHIQQMPNTIPKLLRLHNNIMRYTAIMFAFSTGFRAVRSPLLPPSQIDEKTGFAVISDKDGIDYYNARIVWLPRLCRLQYQAYLTHLGCLLPKLEYLDLNAFNALRHLLDHPTPSDKIPLFFFLRIDGNTAIIRPLDIWKEIRNKLQYDLPANAGRHYLRSNLMERGCPPELVAAFMGHWERGEEPWGKYSALSPLQYASSLASYITPMLEEDGWAVMTGMQEHW